MLEHDVPDLGIFDLKLPDGTGIDLLRELKRAHPEIPIILMTAFGEIETAVEAMSAGAYWFVKKPFQNEELLALAGRALESQKLWLELRRLRNTAFTDEDYLHSSSPRMQECYAIAEQVARGDTTSVLIEGESGTGKEYFANLIHRMSGRHDKPFVEINCAAIPSELLESELFGHEKGAFTDARTQKQGLLELANNGTLFLDEIGEMSAMLQVKLLRVLERRIFKRVGGMKDISVNVRIISATNQDLDRSVQEGRFREDLYYRLKVVPLFVPPLRERREDILPLSRLFMDRFARQFKKPFREIGPAAERILLDYPWPGNIRELKNLFERTVLLETGERLEPHHLKLSARPRADAELTVGQKLDEFLNGSMLPESIPFEALIEQAERALILRASCATNWNQSKTAELLQLKRDKLRYRMKLYQINGSEGRSPGSSGVDLHVAFPAFPGGPPRPVGLAARRRLVRLHHEPGPAARAPEDRGHPGLRERHDRVHARAGRHERGHRALREGQPPAGGGRALGERRHPRQAHGLQERGLRLLRRQPGAGVPRHADLLRGVQGPGEEPRDLERARAGQDGQLFRGGRAGADSARTELDGRKEAITKIADEILTRSVEGW